MTYFFAAIIILKVKSREVCSNLLLYSKFFFSFQNNSKIDQGSGFFQLYHNPIRGSLTETNGQYFSSGWANAGPSWPFHFHKSRRHLLPNFTTLYPCQALWKCLPKLGLSGIARQPGHQYSGLNQLYPLFPEFSYVLQLPKFWWNITPS